MFSATRFARLAKAEWVENRRAWAWFLGIVVILHFVLVLILLAGDRPWSAFTTEAQAGVFWVGLFLTAPVFAARHFQALGRPGPALVALMRPATAFEKWLLALLVVGVAYPLAYHLVYFICDLPATWIAANEAAQELARQSVGGHAEQRSLGIPGPERFAIYHLLQVTRADPPLAGFLLSLTTLQAFAVAGSLVFTRWPFLKTLLTGFFILLASILVTVVFDSNPDKFLGYWGYESNEGGPVLPGWAGVVYPAVWIAVPALLWLAAYLGLREREVGR